MSTSRQVRSVVLLLSIALLAAPLFGGLASSADATTPVAASVSLSFGLADEAAASQSILSFSPTGPTLAGIDDPGAAYGFPNENTLGFTTRAGPMDAWRYEWQGPVDFQVDMGKLVKKTDIAGEEDYILEVYFDIVGWFWFDGDGVFDPAPNNVGYGAGDDPCPEEPMDLFTVSVNGQEIRTLQGHNTQPCAPGGPEVGRAFEIIAIGDDLPNQVRVPKDVLREGKNDVRLDIKDFVTGPPNSVYHSETYDGWQIYLHGAAIELAAPPLVLSHGWSSEWDPGTGTVPWQPTFKANIVSEFAAHTGQNPWRWAQLQGKDGILLNFYDKKQDFRQSARELRGNVQAFHDGLGFSGKGWMHGHSMGGLVSRYYLEVLGGNAKIEKFAQTGTPNLGSWEAHAYTYGYWLNYEAADEEYTANWHWILPGWPTGCCVKMWHGWRDWWNPSIWAYQRYEGAGHGRDHLADFLIKPPGSNPPLAALNMFFPASGVEYFTVRGDCNAFTSMSCALAGPLWRGDGAVGLDSATMNGAIRHRTIDAFHEDIPAQPQTARWMMRYWSGLDLDTGRPSSTAPSLAPSFAPLAAQPEGPATQAGNANLLIGPADVAEGPFEHVITLDSVPRAEFTALVLPSEDPLRLSLRAPDGTLHEPDVQTPGVTYTAATGAFVRSYQYAIDAPAPGAWTMLLEPEDVPSADGMPVVVSAFLPGAAVSFTAATAATSVAPGEPAWILATLLDGGAPLADSTVLARTVDAQGAPVDVTLRDDGASSDGAAGDGVYAARIETAGLRDGALAYEVLASGAGSQGAFQRGASVELVVASTTDLRLVDVSGAPAGAWGGDAVTLSATVASEGQRAVEGGATVQFYDGDPQAGGALLGSVDLAERIPVGEVRVATLPSVAPSHALDLHVRVDSLDLELDMSDNTMSAPMPFVASPRTVATVDGARGEGEWLLGEATVTLATSDGSAPSGTLSYSLDEGPWQPYSAPFLVAAEGAHTLSYRATDAQGNVEPLRAATFGIDRDAPTGELLSPVRGFLHAGDQRAPNPRGFTGVAGVIDVVVRASDAASGVAHVELLVDGEAAKVLQVAQGTDGWHLLWDSSGTSLGYHDLGWSVSDASGQSVSGSLRVYVLAARGVQVDRQPPDTLERITPGGA